jgi:serine/threonine protein kinase/Tfp pilus assembly protein PilF
MIHQQSSPSGDDSLLNRAIAEFLKADSAGTPGNRQQWLERYPQCAAELAEFFDDLEHVGGAVAPLRINSSDPPSQSNTTGDVAATSDPLGTLDFSPPPSPLLSTRYRLGKYHAGGGMGEIWIADDERIGRRVAVKKMRNGRNIDHSRFFVEAQITGQLEHPSVVPLHDLGIDDDGRPFYVMKFIRGRRLREAIAEFHTRKVAEDWTEDVDFRRLLEILVTICNTVAYAHSKGVLHRDIKPDNVMLGPYGETLVVDWGLAKVLGQKEQLVGSGVTLTSGASTATQDGTIVGSPYYMPPEGAEGHPEAVDQTSDVYLLGATLYEILTERPPRRGSSNWELIDLALHSRPTAPRKVNPRVPRPLEAICLKAMAFRKQDRYQTPLELAADVERFLAGAPVAAYAEPLTARIVRWIRRHRRALSSAAAAMSLLTLAAFAYTSYREASVLASRESARTALANFYRLADEAQFYAANSDPIGEEVPYYDPGHGQELGKTALAIASQWGTGAETLPLAEERDNLRDAEYSLLTLLAQSQLSSATNYSEPRTSIALLDQAKLLREPSRGLYLLYSRAHKDLGDFAAADNAERNAQSPDVGLTAQDHFLQGEFLRKQDAAAAAAAFGSASPPSREHLEAALGEYRATVQLDPKHYWAQFQLGRCLLALGRPREAVEALGTCIADRPSSPWAYTTRGLANALAGRPQEAKEDLNRAVALQPDFAPARLNRGAVNCWLLDEVDSGLKDFDTLLEVAPEKRLVEAEFYRGQARLRAGNLQGALADFDSAIKSKPDFSPAFWGRARSRFTLGDFDGGLADLQKYQQLTHANAENGTQAEEPFERGKLLRLMGQQLHDEPRKHVLERAAEELQSATSANPKDAEAWQYLGAVQEMLGWDAKAVEVYTQGLTHFPDDLRLHRMRGWEHANHREFDLAQADFTNAIHILPQDGESHAGLGFVLAQKGRSEDAQHEAVTALLANADSHLALHYVACVFGRLSVADSTKRTEHENLALSALDRAVSLSERNPIGPDADELTLIQHEDSFPDSLRQRPEFQRMLRKSASMSRD